MVREKENKMVANTIWTKRESERKKRDRRRERTEMEERKRKTVKRKKYKQCCIREMKNNIVVY